MARNDPLRLKRFGILSVAKMSAVFGLVFGIIMLIVLTAVGAVGGRVLAGFGIGVGLLVAFSVGFFALGAVMAFLYNVIARAVGPIRLSLKAGKVVSKVVPLSYAKVSFVLCLIVYGILAIFLSSALLSAIGVSTSQIGTLVNLPISLIVGAFIFAIVVYGFLLPLVWGFIYNKLADRLGGISITLKKGRVEEIDIMSFVKISVSLSIIFFIIERMIGAIVSLALGYGMGGGGNILLDIAMFFGILIAVVVIDVITVFLYNVFARRIGGIELELIK